MTNIKDVKPYSNVCTLGRDGLLIVRRDQPLAAACECIVVPRQVLDGLLTAIHLRLSHPMKHQLKNVMTRYFFALDMDQAIQRTTAACHQCASLLTAPKYRVEQSSEDPPDALGVTFATDVIRRACQMILILRECVTSYSVVCFVANESHDALHEAIVSLCIPLVPLDGPRAVIRADPAPGFVAPLNDPELHRLRIHIEMGRVKNRNKNPVAEKAVQEFQRELLCIDPSGAPVSLSSLLLRLPTSMPVLRIGAYQPVKCGPNGTNSTTIKFPCLTESSLCPWAMLALKPPHTVRSLKPHSPPTQLLLWVTSYIYLVMAARPRGGTGTWWLLLMVHGVTSESLPANNYVAHHTGWRNRNAFSSHPQSPCKRSQRLPSSVTHVWGGRRWQQPYPGCCSWCDTRSPTSSRHPPSNSTSHPGGPDPYDHKSQCYTWWI